MRKTCVATLVTASAVGLFAAADDPKALGRVEDEKAIRALIEELGKSWNAHDMKGFSAHLAEDVDVVNRFGQCMSGRAGVEAHLIGLHASPYRDHLVDRSSKVDRVRFLTPDVALVLESAKEETGQSVRTYVLQKRDGRWWVQSAHVTELKAPGAG
jgi:uncharacterized protein (TIGR02246 family)